MHYHWVRECCLLVFLLILLACLRHKEKCEMSTHPLSVRRCDRVEVPWQSKEIWFSELTSVFVSTSFSHFYRNYNRFWIWKLFGSTRIEVSKEAHSLS